MDEPVYVLIHSPLVGPATWARVAEEMQQRGIMACVPALSDSPDSAEPFWKQHAASLSDSVSQLSPDTGSGAGPLLPAIRQTLPHTVQGYVFVDAGIPRHGAGRLDLMKSEDPEWGRQFEQYLTSGGKFPNWSFDDLQELIPNEILRRRMVEEIRPRSLRFFTEPIPVFEGWPDAPCAYIQLSATYTHYAAQARQAGWPTDELLAGHFHMLVDPKVLTDRILHAGKNQS
jgi:hypothetical protein